MASPLNTGKAPINLAPQAARGSRIRRDPPPAAKKTVVPDRDELARRGVAVGVVTFALAIVVIIIGFGSWAGWSASQYTINIQSHE